jgi:hypothetical protein
MAYVTKVPSTVTIGSVEKEQRKIERRGNQIYLTEWAQIEDDQTLQIIAGPKSFTVHCGRNDPDWQQILEDKIVYEIDRWRVTTLAELADKGALGDFETKIEAELAKK